MIPSTTSLFAILFIIITFCLLWIKCENMFIHTLHGTVKGRIVEMPETSKKHGVFLAVPFAKPPIGKLRFQVIFNKHK